MKKTLLLRWLLGCLMIAMEAMGKPITGSTLIAAPPNTVKTFSGTGFTKTVSSSLHLVGISATITLSDVNLRIGETSNVTITFSEAASNFDNADLSIPNGMLSPVGSADGGVTWTATYTPSMNVEDMTNMIVLDNTGVTDVVGNAGAGVTNSPNFSIDTRRPTVQISFEDPFLKIGEKSKVTFLFSESVLGFGKSDFSIANGDVTSLSSSDGGITWTATFTPNVNVEDWTNVITLDNTGVTDVSGNAGMGVTDSENYQIDTRRPTATITVSDDDIRIGETATVTITFSEAVTDFTKSDVLVENGMIDPFISVDGGITWTTTFTPNPNIEVPTNIITLDNSGVLDLRGNSGSGSIDSPSFKINTKPPTLTLGAAVNPTTCNGTGSIAFTSTNIAAGSQTLAYKKDAATTATTVTVMVEVDGSFTLTGLGAGVYSDFVIGSTSASGSKTLSNPSYTLTAGSPTQPTSCGGNGSVPFTTDLPSGTYTLTYKKGGVAQSASVTASSPLRVASAAITLNSFTLSGISAGTYTDFKIVYGGCDVVASGPVTLSDPAKPTFTVGTAVKPTTCNATDGSLPLNGLANSTSYSVSYQKDGAAAVVQTLNSNTSGVLTISNVGVGSYTNIKVTLNGCESATATATIAAPTFTLTAGTVTQPTTCGGNGSIPFTTSLPSGTYTLTYKKGGVAQSASVTANSPLRVASAAITLNSFTLSGISAGTYTDFKIVYGGCDVVASGPVTLSDPAKPTFTVGTAVKPTTCIATDGSLPLTGLANSTSYSVSYQKDGGLAVVQTLSSNASGVLTVSNLGVGSYTNIKVALNGCESTTATATIAAPTFVLTVGVPTHPTTCGGAGSIAFTTTLPSGTYTLSYKKGGVAQSASVIVGSSIRAAAGAAIGNSFTLSGVTAGSYTDFKITYGGCEVTASGPAVLSDPSGPSAFSVTGGGSFCTGGTGLPVGLNGSQIGVNYQLKRGSENVGSAMPGTGSALLFGTQSTTGTYTVVATNTMTLCNTTMTGSAVINNYPQPTASISGNASVCKDGAPALVSFTATAGTAPYQFNYKVNNGVTQVVTSNSATVTVPQATNVAGVFVYSLVSMQDGNGCSQTQSGSVTVNVLTKPSITLTANGQTLVEGNNQAFCDIDANSVNGLQFTVTTACVAGSPVWRVQVGGGSWSDWTTNPPVSQLSNNQSHRYQAACDATCPTTYTSPIELTINYRASAPQNVSMSADGTTVGAGEEKSICDQSGTGLTFSATCGTGERLLYSVDGGDYVPTVPSQLVDGQFHNYRVRCQKSDGTPSCVEMESGAMRLRISVISGAPVASLNVSSGCGLPTNFSGTATCPAGFSTVWYAAATNVALPSLPATTPNVTTSYYARCQNEAGCQSGNSNTVTYTVTSVNEAPVVTVSSELVCTGQEVRVSTSCPVGSTVLWSTGVSESSFTVSFNNVTTQSYTARCVFGNGCQSAVSAAKTVRWKAFELTIINIGQSQSAVKNNDRLAWASQFVTPDGGPILDQSSQSNPTLYYSENLNKTAPRYWTVNVEACALGTGGSLTFDMLVTPETGVPQSFNTHENNAPYFMYANREGWTELYAQNHPAYGFYQDNGAGGNVYDAGLPKGLYKLSVRYWDMKGWGSIYPSTRKPQGNVLAYQEYWFRIQSKDGVGVGATRTAADNGQWIMDNGFFAQVAPNPVSNTLHLKVNEAKGQKVNVSLSDASGRTLLKRQFVSETNTHQEEFGVSELPTGMYFLQVNAGDKQAILKVIKVQ